MADGSAGVSAGPQSATDQGDGTTTSQASDRHGIDSPGRTGRQTVGSAGAGPSCRESTMTPTSGRAGAVGLIGIESARPERVTATVWPSRRTRSGVEPSGSVTSSDVVEGSGATRSVSRSRPGPPRGSTRVVSRASRITPTAAAGGRASARSSIREAGVS